jgi:transcriptional regulator with XRE-family HTH domain
MDRLTRLRELKGYSQRALAKESGVSPATIYELENGRRRPNPSTLRKLAKALGVEVSDLLDDGRALLGRASERPPTERAEVKRWLREHDARFALMTDAEFSDLVLNLEAGADEDDLLEGIENLVGEITEEDLTVERALNREFAHGGALFPNTPAGPDLTKRLFARHKEVMRLRRALTARYQVFRRSLANYSMRLFEAGRTSDFLVHPRLKETVRRQLLEEAFAEEGAA